MIRYKVGALGVWDDVLRKVIAPGTVGWVEYQIWLNDVTNVPDFWAYTPPAPSAAEVAAQQEVAERDTIRQTLRLDAAVQALKNRTPAQVDAWIDANVTDLASARAVLKIIARILALLARERL